jgi:hypothetical protein
MPTPHHLKNLAVPGNRYTVREAASEGLIVSIRCTRCRRPPVLFLAADLAQVLDPGRDCFYPPPFPCSRCGETERIEVKLRSQDEAAVGKLLIRRLAGIRRVPVWRDELLGDRPAPAPGG